MASRKENIVIFPFMAQGHIIPYLALALKIEKEKGYDITFINTPLNIRKLHSCIPKTSSIRLLEIPFNSADHGLPPNCESTETLPLSFMTPFIELASSLKPAFTNLLIDLVNEKNGIPPLCIISDMFFGWSAEIAHKFGILHAIFNAGGAYGMAVLHTMWQNLPHLNGNPKEFSLPDFPEGYTFRFDQLPMHLKITKERWHFIDTTFQEWHETDAMLFNTVEEIDWTGLAYFRKQFSCPVLPIGPIMTSHGSRARGGKEAEPTWKICKEWLDSKPPNSVLYIAFGSQSTPSESQTMELSKALEASGVNFLWVARPPSSFVSNNSSNGNNEWLPEGFMERIHKSKQGLLVLRWVLQMEILSHKSVGGFLSHCGWNSAIESLSNGVPMMSWPMGAEQPFNAKMLEEEIGVCLGFSNGIDSEIKHEEIVKKFKLLIEEKKGKELRIKANIAKEIIENACKNGKEFKGSSVKALDEFLDAALHMRKISKLSDMCSIASFD